MSKHVLLGFDYLSAGDRMRGQEIFNEIINISIGIEGQKGVADFRLHVISSSWLEKYVEDWNDSSSLRHSLVLTRYDEAIAEKHVEDILKMCNKLTEQEAFNCLKYYLEHIT